MRTNPLQWDAVTEERVAQAENSGIDTADVREGLALARVVFGDDIDAVPDLVLRNLLNFAPWTYTWFAWLAGALRALEGTGGYGSIIRRLRRGDLFIEAYSVIQVAERLRSVGLAVDIDVPVEPGGSQPDLRVNDPTTGAVFFAELSDLFLSDRQVTSAQDLDRLTLRLMPMLPGVTFSGQVLGSLSDADVTAVVQRVRDACCKIERGGGYREIRITDTIDFAVGHRAFGANVRAWALARGLPVNGIAGSNSNVNLQVRFERKVARKAKQLPPGLPNVLVVGSTELLYSGAGPRELLRLLGEAVAPHPQVAVIVVTSEEGASSTPAAVEFGSARLLRSYRTGMTQYFLVVPNGLCANPLPPQTLERIRNGFAL